MKKNILSNLLCALACYPLSSALAQSATAPTNFVEKPAVFTVTTEVANPHVQAFTVTGPAFGNTLNRTGKGGFEPATFRTRLEAQSDSPNRIIDDRSSGIGYYDVYASGYLDGAEVRVYRIVNGELMLVREDRVAPGGTVIEYWNTNPQKVIPAGTTEGQMKWADWSRKEAHRWFTVFAVDHAGNISRPATPIRQDRSQAEKGVKEKNHEVNFRAPRNSADTEAPPAPQNFQARINEQGIIECSWDPVAADDLAGYRLGRTDTDPASHRGVYLQMEGEGAPIMQGDMVIVSKSLIDFTPAWLSHRVGGLNRQIRGNYPDGVPNDFIPDPDSGKTWRLVKHEADTPVPNPGEVYFEMTLREGDVELVGKSGIPDISTTQQEYYPVPEDGEEYIMEVWMKADRNDRAPVVFTWDGDKRVGGFVGETALQLTDQWKKYEVRFIGKSAAEGFHAYFVLKTEGPGTFAFDNFHIYKTGTDYLDYLPYQYENLKKSGMTTFRTHGPIKTGTSTYSMRQYLGEAGEAQGVAKGNTLPQALRMMEKAALNPWLQIEYHMSQEEWLGFMEYMAAPYDPATDTAENKPWAALRYEQGQQEPWIKVFPHIYFELSNETWNGLFRPWTFENMRDSKTGTTYPRGAVYAKFHDVVADILRSSPYWEPAYEETFIHVLGGWSATLGRDSLTHGYTQEIANETQSGEYITIAAYNGGWDEGEGPPKENRASYFNVLSQVNQTAIPRIRRLKAVSQNASDRLGREVKFGTYEAGPGYAMNGLNNAKVSKEEATSQENVMKSKLSGVATLDSFLARSVHGSDIDNFFTFEEGNLWKSHAKKHRGGQPHASFLPLVMFNHLATGDMLETETVSVSTVDTPKSRRRQAIEAGPLAAVYATRQDKKVTVICINRQVAGYPDPARDGFTPFEFRLPFTQADKITLYRMSGAPSDHNIYQENVKAESLELSPDTLNEGRFVINASTGADERGLPPSEVYMYVFEGTNIE
ncbi:hypothetical protein P0Y35_09765 [Kiritimatiellaeota bacterium B1221]|nr:hypothetical protein [Kiritimatiellaeota bacterium B1221]